MTKAVAIDNDCDNWRDRAYSAEQELEAMIRELKDYADRFDNVPGATTFNYTIRDNIRRLIEVGEF